VTLEAQLDRLARAATAAREIGLEDDAALADGVVHRARERAGFPGATYVLALAGGTGVGKSSLLNALAGRTVSAVRAVRPTTDEPIAWVAEDRREELGPLMEWLGVREVAGHADDSLAGVAILDLPDVDSVRTEHRSRVDELLPRIDAVAWVVDPEKYDDERLHAYLRMLAAHAPRMRFVLNKADRLNGEQRDELAADLRRRLAAAGIDAPRVSVVSAARGDGMDAFRAELASEADAKGLVADKLATDAREASATLARAVGVAPGSSVEPLLPAEARAAATRAAVEGALAVIDPPGVARQVQAAVLARARHTGGSLLGRVIALLLWITGQQRRSADPAGYLRDWRRRGSLGRAVNPVHAALVEASGHVPARSRAAILRSLGADETEAAVTRALDRVAGDAAAELRVPGSLLWPVIGAVQLVVGAFFAFAVAWYVTLFVSGGAVPVATVDLPVLGPVPLPLVLLAGSILVSAIIGLMLSAHAGWIGRRLGDRLAARVRAAVADAVESAGMSGLDRVEEARRTIGGMT
jgi:GTP-binding protein EngB required for normal cell division